LLFDLGGTLVEASSSVLDTKKGYYRIQVRAIHRSLRKNGVIVDWNSFWKCYELIRAEQKKRSRQTLREYDMCKRVSDTFRCLGLDIPPSSELIKQAVDAYMVPYVNSLKINDCTRDLLKALFVRYKLGLVTNFAYPQGAYAVLDKFNLRPFFKATVISGELGWKKPSPKIFEDALSKLAVKSFQAAYIGDDIDVDISGAKAVGLRTILISREETENQEADATIRDLREIPSAIKQLEK
jgi:putative hydrolase of the HAD superfamily